MVTFKFKSVEKTKQKILEHIKINDDWSIEKCLYTKNNQTHVFAHPKALPTEFAKVLNFTLKLNHSSKKGYYDMYASNIVYFDRLTKKFVRQEFRYYSMYSSKNYHITEDIRFLDHLKQVLVADELKGVIPYSCKHKLPT
jgi:hypothetical protein